MPSWTSPYGVTHDLAELTLDSDDYLREHLGSWFRRIEAHRALFEGRLEEIEFKRRSVSTVPGERNIVFLTYENPWAKTGGVKAVADMQVEAYKQEGENAFRISPLHKGLKCSPNLAGIKPIAVCKVPFQGREYDTVVYKINDAGSPPKEWYLFGSEGFFNSDGGASGTDPY